MIVGNQKSQFSRLTLKRIGVELGTAAQGHFEGVGIIIVSIPENPTEVILLYPSYYSPTDKCPTISTGVLKSTTYFTDVIHHANNKLVLLPSSNSTPLSLPCTVIDGIDFISLHFHTVHNSSSQQKCNKILSSQKKQNQVSIKRAVSSDSSPSSPYQSQTSSFQAPPFFRLFSISTMATAPYLFSSKWLIKDISLDLVFHAS